SRTCGSVASRAIGAHDGYRCADGWDVDQARPRMVGHRGEMSRPPSYREIFMKFLYRCPRIPLEFLCHQWQVIAHRRSAGPAFLDLHQSCASRRATYCARTEPCIARITHMLDVILVAAAIGFFALSVGYTIVCDRL